jgi:hypothetical protein
MCSLGDENEWSELRTTDLGRANQRNRVGRGSQWYQEHRRRKVYLILASRPGTRVKVAGFNFYQLLPNGQSIAYDVRVFSLLPPD